MEKYRDCLGNLYYSIQRTDGKTFEVVHGENKIVENRGLNGRFDAVLYNPVFIWEDLPIFKSFIQAVQYLKENLQSLL